jgi:hypothetical protein
VNHDQSFALELNILPNQASFVIQIASRFVEIEAGHVNSVTRIMSKMIGTSDHFEEVAGHVNWNLVLWFWSRWTLDNEKEKALESLFKATATILKSYGQFVPPDFVKAICSLPDWRLFSESLAEQALARDFISFSRASELPLIPVFDGETQVCLSANGAECSGDESQAAQSAQRFSVFLPVRRAVTPSFLTCDESRRERIERLISSLA